MFEDLEEKLLIVLIGTAAIAAAIGLSKGVSLLIKKLTKNKKGNNTQVLLPEGNIIILPPPEGKQPSGGQ